MLNNNRREVELLASKWRLDRSDTDLVIEQFLIDIDTPRSLTVWMLYKAKEHDQLLQLAVDPLHYNSASSFSADYIATEFLSKSDFLSPTVDKTAKAIEKFRLAEEQCRSTNIFINHLLADRLCVARPDEVLIKKARRKIAKILGDIDGEELFDVSGWGPGVTTFLKGTDVSAYNKFHNESGITQQLYPLCHSLFPMAYPRWSEHLVAQNGDEMFKRCAGNLVITVPKNAKTDRVIAVEPGINLWIQKGIGTIIRRKLRKCGIDLNSQQRNQDLARKGSIHGNLATIDFSSASDTISREVVRLLLPQRWFLLLDDARCHTGSYNKTECFTWEKFSSMGNGFTFELESLIFYALAVAVCDFAGVPISDVSVYGDDVIIPVDVVSSYQRITSLMGFTFNAKKSYSSTPFRESCGSHWFAGVCCKPLFLKKRLSTIEHLMLFVNNVRRLAHRQNNGLSCDIRFINSWRKGFLLAPPIFRKLRVSDGYGDGAFIGDFDECCPTRCRDGIEGFNPRIIQRPAREGSADGLGLLLRSLKYGTDFIRGNFYDKRGCTSIRISRIVVPRWYYLGPWL